MPKQYHRKLVRDNIPKIIRDSGGKCRVRKLPADEHADAFIQKLREETAELANAKSEEQATEELADILEIARAYARLHDIPLSAILAKMKEKRKQNGSFSKGIFLIWSQK